MLKKLMKHELIATARIMLPLYLLAMLLAVFANVTTRLADHVQSWVISTLSGVSIFTFFLALMAVCLMALVIMIGRFHSNLMGPQGYLMMTLPASIHQLVLSKVITSVLWFCGTMVVCILALVALFFDSHTLADMGNFFELLTLLLSDGYEGGGLVLSGGQFAALGLEVCGLMVLAMVCFTLFVYAAIATGHSFSNRKMLLTVLIYLGFGLAGQILSTVVLGNLWFRMLANTGSSLDAIQDFHSFWWVLILYYALWSAGLYVLTLLMTKKRLNLQ